MDMSKIRIIITLFVLIIGCTGQGPTIEIQAVIKGTAHLPCNIRPPVKNDSTILVVWYRNEMDAIYSYDSRRKHSETASHWKNSTVIGSRAFFRLLPEPATLIIEDIKPSDAGSYRCRVDFQRSPTKNHKIWLQVVVPPEKPIIYDQGGKVTTLAGPFKENTDAKFTCRVHGGSPIPKVRWWRNEVLLESSTTTYNAESNHYVESELIIRQISRSDYKAVYTCQASNTNISVPQATTVILDLYLSPLEVTILSSRQPLSADRKYDIVCQSTGSRPPAIIEWYLNGTRIYNHKENISADDNITISTLEFTPLIKDNNNTLLCRANNTKFFEKTIFDKWILDITFPPVATLKFDSELVYLNDVEEGDAVSFHCAVYANPRAYKIVWKHNGYLVQHDPKSGVEINSAHLHLRSINRKQSGNYTCYASNVEGDGESNAIELRVMYKPICKINQKLIYGFGKSENAHISCEVDAYPFADAFSWSFNNSEDTTSKAEKHRKSERKRNGSILHITPVSEVDYGYLLCSAKNVIGEQTEPCVFHIIPAGKPQAPHNCTIVNQTVSSLGVECIPGFDGGQSPFFTLTVINEDSGILIVNSSAPTPSFLIHDLSPGTTLTMNLYAENGRGRSPTLIIEGSTLSSAEKRTGSPLVLSFTPYVVLLLGMTVFCSISAVVIMGAVRAHAFFGNSSYCFRTNRNSTTIKQDLSALEQPLKFDVTDDEDKNPDVVPNTKEDNYEIQHLSRDDTSGSPEYYYPNKKSVTSSSLSSLPTPPSPLCEDNPASWRLAKTMHRNGDIRKKRKKSAAPDIPIDFTEIAKEASTKANNMALDRAKCSESSQMKLENAPSCNIIRMSSQKEIVTVRTPLMSNQQESCV